MLFLGTLTTTVQAISDKDQKLIDAAKNGDIAKVKGLIRDGADVNAKDEDGETALTRAAFEGYKSFERRT